LGHATRMGQRKSQKRVRKPEEYMPRVRYKRRRENNIKM